MLCRLLFAVSFLIFFIFNEMMMYVLYILY